MRLLCPLLLLLLRQDEVVESFNAFRSLLFTRIERGGRPENSLRPLASSLSTSSISMEFAYDGAAIEKEFQGKPFEVWQRLIDIGRYDNWTAFTRTREENEMLYNTRAIDLKDSIIQSGSVALIKSGQALALRPDVIKSPEYIRELTKLQDEVGTFPNEEARRIFKEDLGISASELFEFEHDDPVASASIGQVYKAKLKENNKTYAVKIQRPDILSTVKIDMFIIRKVAGYLRKRFKLRSDLVGIADEFGCQLFDELNYTQEALNAIKFKQLYGRIKGIYVPDVRLEHTSQRVLTMEFVEGVKGPWSTGGERMLTIGLQCSVLQLLESGFFHADPHRGNLLQTPSGDLAYLDFGMMSSVSAKDRYALIGAVLGLVNKDLSLVVFNLKKLNFFPPETDVDVVVEALSSALANSTTKDQVSSLNFTQLNQNVMSISFLLPIRLPPFYTLIIRTLTILEGLALYVDPSFRLIRGAYPFIAKQLLSSDAPELGKLLQAVIVNKEGRIRWMKLEQFISIASNADAAIDGNFKALQYAQERSDLLRTYQNNSIEGNFTIEVSVKIIDFLLSSNGRFLRDSLILELVETVDSMGLTALTIASLATNEVIPKPPYRPDEERVQQFLRFLEILSSSPSLSLSTTSSSGIIEVLQLLFRLISTAASTLRKANDPALNELMDKSSILVSQIVAGLIEKNTRRISQSIASPSNVQASLETFLPVLNRILSLVAPIEKNSKF